MVNNETWLTGEEASKYFNIEVTNPVEAVACASNYFEKYNKVPKNISKENVTRATVEDNVVNNVNNEAEKNMLLMELDLI